MDDEQVTWLGAQLDEDERVAVAVPEAARSWTLDGGTIHAGHPTDEVVDWVSLDGAREHIVRHDPARVLRRVAVGREILAKYQGAMAQESKRPDDEVNRGYVLGIAAAADALMMEYVDRPGFRPPS